MLDTLHIAKFKSRLNVCILSKDKNAIAFDTLQMAKQITEKTANHLKAWREFRRMSQEELAEAIGTTGSVISLLESGTRGLSLKWLLKLAPALKTSPGFLLDHDPNDIPIDMLDLWGHIDVKDRPRALKILETFTRDGSSG